MSGKLIIQGKAWGEFESAKRSKGNIEISGYRSYGGTHTVRMVEQPQLNENQQIVFEWLKGSYVQGYGATVIRTIHLLQKENTVDISGSSYVRGAYRDLNTVEEAVVVKMFADWALEQEEE